MILLNSFPLTWQQVRKLPKLNHHIREKAMVDFVQQVIRERLGDQDYPDNLINDNFGKVVKEECTYDGNTWTFVFKEGQLSWAQYLESFMRLGAFGNKPLNENVYFYRLINIIKKELPDIIFESMLKQFKNSDDENLRGNIKEYISYQSKIDQIEKFVSENEIQVSEHWDRT